jgi:uncharacterized membrane protein
MIKAQVLRSWWASIYFLKSEINRLLLTSVAFGLLMVMARIVYTGQLTFAFLLWNLFLAFVPYLLSYQLLMRPAWIESNWKFASLFTIWLLFVPNSFYILTDLFHLYDSDAVPRWYDLMLIFSFAWNAMLLGILSVRQMEKIIQARWQLKNEWFFVYPIMWLNAEGVYIGRYLRYNSWDVISNPFRLMADIMHMILHPLWYKDGWGMIVCFSFFLSIVYMTIKKLSKTVW